MRCKGCVTFLIFGVATLVALVLSFPLWVWFVSLCVRAAVDWGWLP